MTSKNRFENTAQLTVSSIHGHNCLAKRAVGWAKRHERVRLGVLKHEQLLLASTERVE